MICNPYQAFQTKIGLGVHRNAKHRDIVNDEIDISRKKKAYPSEEIQILALEEAKFEKYGRVDEKGKGLRFVNIYLQSFIPETTIESIKGLRKQEGYRNLVCQILNALPEHEHQDNFHTILERDQEDSSSSEAIADVQEDPPSPSENLYGSSIRDAINEFNAMEGFQAACLTEIAHQALKGKDVKAQVGTWITSVFPPPKVRAKCLVRRGTQACNRLHRRRREYAVMQSLFKKNMSHAAKLVLDGEIKATTPALKQMEEFWGPIFGNHSLNVTECKEHFEKEELKALMNPITSQEIMRGNIDLSSAAGPDGISPRQWRAVPAILRALLYNVCLMNGGFPNEMLMSRTIFIPKKDNSIDPGDFRPISVTSVVVRQLHKILARRLLKLGVIDERQRCLEDGCAENITILASLLNESKKRRREIHVASLDVAKAFDSVSHSAIEVVLKEEGFPSSFIRYIISAYARSTTIIDMGLNKSAPIKIGCGVRQGDPLSSPLFCLVVDKILRAIPEEVGFQSGNIKINATAYADDLNIVTSTKLGMEIALMTVEVTAGKQGLILNGKKCTVLSMIPSGRDNKLKFLTEPQFKLMNGTHLRQLRPTEEWRYLGVDFSPLGLRPVNMSLENELERIGRAPLKPQQRLKILRCFLITRFYHRLVLGKCTLKVLRRLDLQVRAAIRRWLRLPKDVPIGYYHAMCSAGGLGIPSFVTSIPGCMYHRMNNMQLSTSTAARELYQNEWVQNKIRWAERVLKYEGQSLINKSLRDKYWISKVYTSVDGNELRESGFSNLSTKWIDENSLGIPGRDYVQYHHVHINALPTRVRTTRGRRPSEASVLCRAGCRCTESLAHVIQGCHRSHGGRMKRHDTIIKVIANAYKNKGWRVEEEPHFNTRVGLRKPDLLVQKDGQIKIIDAQVVSGSGKLVDTHSNKVNKYKGIGIEDIIVQDRSIKKENIKVGSCTISWRGVWAKPSADGLLEDLSISTLAQLTTIVLQGSSTNWNRWNRRTSMRQGIG